MTLLYCLPISVFTLFRKLRLCGRTMKVCGRRFNLYLALALAMALAPLCGCRTSGKKEKNVSAIRIHVQTSSDTIGASQTVSVMRSEPVQVVIGHEPILTEASVVAARVIETPGGFAIEIKFDETSGWVLEQFSAANPGKHLVIFGQWGDKL